MKLRLGAVALLCMAGCEASDTTIDPGDLTMRDLLGFDPDVALHWDASQRASARDVLEKGMDIAPKPADAGLGTGVALDERVASTLADLDDTRAAAGDGALGVVRVRIGGALVDAEPVPVELDESATPPAQLVIGDGWDPSLVARGSGLLAAMALDAGHDGGPLVVSPAPRLAVAAAYVDAVPAGTRAGADGRAHLLVNPVVIAALDPVAPPAAEGAVAVMAPAGSPTDVPATASQVHALDGNPYSFYGSVDECAYAEQLRCEGCLPSNTCEPRTIGGDGNAECTTLGATPNAYDEWCINMSLAIDGVSSCVKDKDSSCAMDVTAVHQIDTSALTSNDDFLTDTTCKSTLDQCLGDLFGPSTGTYPPQGGTDQPRDTNVSCGDSSPNCDFSPSCDVQGPSCNNSLSCGGGCSSSADQSGCGGDCGSSNGGSGGGGCQSCSGGSPSGSGGGCGSCDSGSSSGGSSNCGSCSSGSSSGGSSSCGSCSSGSSGSGGGGCSGGDCGGSSGGGCGGSGGGGGCGGGGSNSNCSIAGKTQTRPLGVLLQVFWALIPVPFAARARRRAKAKKKEVQS